jgi:hypothetical protein
MEVIAETNAPIPPAGTPAWAMAVAAPGTGFGMVDGLRGVPKPALQTVFGKGLGHRIWQQIRVRRTSAKPNPAQAPARVANRDIAAGMVKYVSEQAAKSLQAHARLAKAIGLRLTYANGRCIMERVHLRCATNRRENIVEAATTLLGTFPAGNMSIVSIDLTMTTVEAIVLRQSSGQAGFPMMGVPAIA